MTLARETIHVFTDVVDPTYLIDTSVGAHIGATFINTATGRVWTCTTAASPAVWDVGSGTGTAHVTKTTTYTAVAGDYVEADATAAAFTVTLPASPSAGHVVEVAKMDSTAYIVTVAGNGNTISGSTTAQILVQYDVLTFVFGSSQWVVS